MFYNGLKPADRTMINATTGGSIMTKTEEEAFAQLEEMAQQASCWDLRGAKKEVLHKEAMIYTLL